MPIFELMILFPTGNKELIGFEGKIEIAKVVSIYNGYSTT